MKLAISLLLTLALATGVAVAAEPHQHEHGSPPPAAPLPGGSLYRLDATLDVAGRGPTSLASLAGRPVVVTMFYSRCTVICPVLTLAMQRTEQALSEEDRGRVQFVMVSLDDAHDTAAVLKDYAAEHHIDTSRWILAHADGRDVRLLASGLGIRYRKLPDGTYSHSSVLTALDASGVAIARTEDLTGADPALVAALHQAL